MCDVLLPPGVNPTAVKNIYCIISYIISSSATGNDGSVGETAASFIAAYRKKHRSPYSCKTVY
jgi:hypothetical protein